MTLLKFKKLSLEDKPHFCKYFTEYPSNISEYTFTNLFVWNDSKQIEFTEFEGHLILLMTADGKTCFLPPIGPEPQGKIIPLLLEYAEHNNFPFCIKKAPKDFVNKLKKYSFVIEEDRDNFDYIYRAHDLAELSGRKYDGKRGFIKKFKAQYKYNYINFTTEHINCCLPLAEEWMYNRDKNNPALQNELKAIEKIISYAGELSIIGGFIRIFEKTIAFTFGEKLNHTTFVIHFEKADPEYTGSYQVINQLFIQNQVDGKYKYVNREQDLGIESIRKAKLSYNPCILGKKYTITIK